MNGSHKIEKEPDQHYGSIACSELYCSKVIDREEHNNNGACNSYYPICMAFSCQVLEVKIGSTVSKYIAA